MREAVRKSSSEPMADSPLKSTCCRSTGTA